MMDSRLQLHMYVRCPFDREHPGTPRDFITGQVVELDPIADTATIRFLDPFHFRAYYEEVPEEPISCPTALLLRVSLHKNAVVRYRGSRCTVMYAAMKDGWFYYYIRSQMDNTSVRVREDKIEAPFTAGKIHPLDQLRRYEFQNPVWYLGRSNVSRTVKILENSVYGFRELAGCKIYLLPHQMNTIMRCLQEDTCRYMLADEVGMGKTIEASAILKMFLLNNAKQKVLIVVPEPLVEQWRTELFLKFDISPGCDRKMNIVQLIGIDEIADYKDQAWDFVIVDEVHKLLRDEGLYRDCHELSRNARNVILLSATPIQQKEDQYLNLLRLILPEKYDGVSLDAFRKQVNQQQKITRSMYGILADFEDLIEAMDAVDAKKTAELPDGSGALNPEGTVQALDLRQPTRAAEEEEPAYSEDEDCADIYDDITGGLEDLQQLIDDDFVGELIDRAGDECTADGKAAIQELIAYVCDNYQLEKNIIRNRRRVISEDMARRQVKDLHYELDPERNTYESATYDAIVDWITGQNLSAEEFSRHYIPLLEAFFSSAWVFDAELRRAQTQGVTISEEVSKNAAEWLREENHILKTIETVLTEPYNYSNRMVSVIDYIDQETEGQQIVIFTNYVKTLTRYEEALKRWFGERTVAVFYKGMSVDDLEQNIYRFQNVGDCRILLCDKSGGEGRNLQIADVVLHIDLPWDANAIEQRIGRLDRLGRDADKPVLSVVVRTENTLEQELFRFWKDGLKVFNQSLSGLEIIMNEINESIIAAVTHDFRYGISDAIENVVRASAKMEEDIRQEQLFDTASFLYGALNQQLSITLDKYHRYENQLFTNSMMGWATLAGFKGKEVREGVVCFSDRSFSVGSAVRTLFIPPLWEEYVNKKSNRFARKYQDMYEEERARSGSLSASRSGNAGADRSGNAGAGMNGASGKGSGGAVRRVHQNERTIQGTFDRKLAIENDYLHFFAPGDEVYDSIVNNALSSDKGQCAAFAFIGDFDWQGFVFTMSLEPNDALLLQHNIPLTAVGKFKSYISMDQTIVAAGLEAYADVPSEKVVAQVEKLYEESVSRQRGVTAHLGKRSAKNDFLGIKNQYNCSNLEWFKARFPEDVWLEQINDARKRASSIAVERFRESSGIKSAQHEVDRMMNTDIARARYYGTEPQQLEEIRKRYRIIIQALQKSQIVIEAAAFVWIIKEREA